MTLPPMNQALEELIQRPREGDAGGTPRRPLT